MVNQMRFWLAVLAIIFFGVGTFPSIHGVLFWLMGVACIAILYNWDKWNDNSPG
jgi:hypothetical protein